MELTMRVPCLEELARADAHIDRELGEAILLSQYALWARTGMITAAEWACYQAVYTDALHAPHVSPAGVAPA